MKAASRFILISAALIAAGSTATHAQGWSPPAESVRCPSKWGANDTRGAMNHQKPEAVLKAGAAHQEPAS